MKTGELKPKKPIYEDDLCLSGKKKPCLVFQDCSLSHHHISSLMYLKIIHVEKANIIVNFFAKSNERHTKIHQNVQNNNKQISQYKQT